MSDQFEIFCRWAREQGYDDQAPWSRVAKAYKETRLAHAGTSPGPVNCNIRITYQNEFRPLDGRCERCGSMDDQSCPFFTPDGRAK